MMERTSKFHTNTVGGGFPSSIPVSVPQASSETLLQHGPTGFGIESLGIVEAIDALLRLAAPFI